LLSSPYSFTHIFQSTTYDKFRDLICDAHQFIGAFGHPIAQSAPHIYISALPFTPEHTSIAKHFLPRFPHILALSIGKPTDWSPCVFTSEHHTHWVKFVAFSPDEKYFVSASEEKSVCVCDSETGNLISGPFTSTGQVKSSFFDPNSQHIWASCWDGQVIGWDIETGNKCLWFQAGVGGVSDIIRCYFCNGGQNIVSISSQQGTVTLWNANTREPLWILLRIPCVIHSQVSFSPDGQYMAWAEHFGITVRIWKLVDRTEI
jgi:WD40 repeat protein